MCFAAMAVSVVVANLSVLEAADHIKWKRLQGYDHHAIVEFVDHESGQIHVIEYGSDNEGFSFGKGVVKESTIHGVVGMYKYVYPECDDVHEVLQRAKSRLGERKYNPCTNNCEHFATWCKTGQGCCTQVRSFIKRVCVGVAENGSGMLVIVYRRSGDKLQVNVDINPTTVIAELEELTARSTCCSSCKQVLKRIYDDIANGGIDVVGFLVLTELISFSYSCYKAQQTYKDVIQHAENDVREIFKRQRNRDITEAGCESALAVAGTAIGALLGSSFPVVGTCIGSLIGNFIGHWGGRALGRRYATRLSDFIFS